MGGEKPEVGEFVRISVELHGRTGLTQKEYDEWKNALKKVSRDYHAKVKKGERIKKPKAIPNARGKKRG